MFTFEPNNNDVLVFFPNLNHVTLSYTSWGEGTGLWWYVPLTLNQRSFASFAMRCSFYALWNFAVFLLLPLRTLVDIFHLSAHFSIAYQIPGLIKRPVFVKIFAVFPVIHVCAIPQRTVGSID